MSEDESEVTTTVSETESKAPTVESGATFGEERTLSSVQEQGGSLQESHNTQTLSELLKNTFIPEKSKNGGQKEENA